MFDEWWQRNKNHFLAVGEDYFDADLHTTARAAWDAAKDACADACLNERVDADATGAESDFAYNQALDDAVKSIRAV